MCIQNTAVGKYGWSIDTKIKSSTKILQKSVAKAEPCRTPGLALLYLGSRCRLTNKYEKHRRIGAEQAIDSSLNHLLFEGNIYLSCPTWDN